MKHFINILGISFANLFVAAGFEQRQTAPTITLCNGFELTDCIGTFNADLDGTCVNIGIESMKMVQSLSISSSGTSCTLFSISNCEFGGETFDGPITIDDMRTVGFDNATVAFTCTVS